MQNYLEEAFDEDQKAQIRGGKTEDLDVSYYADSRFMAIQMRQIRMGLQDGLDVTVYNKPEYDWFQMEEIRKGMKAGINYKAYTDPKVDYKRMRQIRKGMESGIDLSPYIRLEAGILEELRKAIASNVSIIEYIKEGYSVSQLAEIRTALEKKQNIRPFITKEFLAPSIREISLGLDSGLPVETYATMDYGWQQMRELRLGMIERLDVSIYSNNLFSWQQMRELRLGLEEGLDVTSYRTFAYMPSDMERIRKSLQAKQLDDAYNITVSMEKQLDDIYNSAMSMANPVEHENVKVFVSNDEMEACVEIAGDKHIVIKAEDIYTTLKLNGVTHGIDDKIVKDIIKERKYRQTIVVAKGTECEQGKDGEYEFFFNPNPDRSPRILADGSADFKNINWCELVQKGQKVAYYHSPTEGRDGVTVTGRVLKGRKGKEKNMLSGKGFVLQQDGKTYTAILDGKIDMIGEERIEISRACVLQDVNLSTGNINFDGTVYVMGNVERGASIYATEDIVVNGYVEAATLRSGGNICLNQGANGGGIGLIEAKGDVNGQFFESTYVVAGGSMSAQYCLNCEITIDGALKLHGEKAMLAGGFTRASRGVSAYNIGNKAGITTVIHVGVDNHFMNKIWAIESRIKNVNKELSILGNSYISFQRKYAPEVRNTMEIYLKIENAIYTKELQMKGLVEERDELEALMKEMTGAEVAVAGILHDGTDITIDNIRWKSFGIRGAFIRNKKGRIVVESN